MFPLLQNQEPDVLGSIPPSNGYTSEDGEDGGDVTGVGSRWRNLVYWGSSPLFHRYISEDGEDGCDVTRGLQVE